MHPVVFRVFGRDIPSYGAMLVLGFLAAIWFAARRAGRYGMDKEKVLDLGILLLIAGVVGSRIGWVLQEWKSYADHPITAVYVWEGGLTFHGGLILAIVAAVWWCHRNKVSFWQIADLMSAPLAIGYAVGRIGCFLNGCCGGAPCDLPWAVRFPGDSIGHHPSQLYAMALNLVIFGVLVWMEKRRKFEGQLFAALLVMQGLYRFLVEYTRAGSSSTYLIPGWLTDAQAVALAIALAGVVVYVVLARRAPVAVGAPTPSS